MKTYLVTGAAGFIGANYIKYILAKHSDVKVVILDALTYAGNLGTGCDTILAQMAAEDMKPVMPISVDLLSACGLPYQQSNLWEEQVEMSFL